MPTLTVKSARRPDGGRQGRNGSFTELFGPQFKQVAENAPAETVHAPQAVDGFTFAFWSILGSAGGNVATLANPAPYSVGTTDILARAWYVRAGMKPQPGLASGVYVDAFDIDTGLFFDDPFVGVINPDFNVNLALWPEANITGFVPTVGLDYAEALTPVGSHGFERWECVDGAKEPSNGALLTAAQGSNAQAVAFYGRVFELHPRPDPRARIGHERTPLAGTWVSWGVKVDGGGPTGGGPIGPWGGLVMEMAAGVAVAEAAEALDQSLRRDTLKLAARQVSLAAERLQQALEAAAKAAKK
jgi:hypothetical protein